MTARLLLTAATLALGAGMAHADYSLTLLHTNDFHDRYEPISKYDSTCPAEDNTAGECFGGSARLVTALRQEGSLDTPAIKRLLGLPRNALIEYLVSKGADPTGVSRRGQTTVDMANGPVQRISPFPETIALLESMGAINNHNCQSC